MIDLITIFNTVNTASKSLTAVYEYLSEKAKTKNIKKRFVFRELQNNLKRLKNARKPNVKLDQLILSLENEAILKAMKAGFDFNDLADKKIVVEKGFLIEKRNFRYIGWNCEALVSSIDSKIEVLKDSISYFDDYKKSNTNFRLKLSNLYFQILLLVVLINQSNQK